MDDYNTPGKESALNPRIHKIKKSNLREHTSKPPMEKHVGPELNTQEAQARPIIIE